MNKVSEIKDAVMVINARYFGIAASIAPRKDVRYYLNGVFVQPGPKKKGAVIVATDGHRMIAMYDRDGRCEKDMIVSITPQMISACLKSPGHIYPDVLMVLTKDNSLIVGPGGRGDASVAIYGTYRHPYEPLIDGKYAEWKRVIATAEDVIPGLPASYNGSYLADFYKLAKFIDPKGHSMTFFQHKVDGDRKSVFVRSPANKDFLGVLMPMRYDQVESIPAWATSSQEAA